MHASLTRHFCVTCFKIVALDPVFHRANLTVGTRDFELMLQFSLLFFFLSWTLYYTCQLSCLRRESHACGLKTSISRRLTLAGQFLTPDWKIWVVAILLDTISKNMLTQTHVRKKTMCKMNKWQYQGDNTPGQYLPRDLWFLKWKALGASSRLYAS